MFWTDAWKLGASLWANGVAVQQTAAAADAVIRHRSGTIDAALRNPLAADTAELGRMVPEKMAAFGEAGRIAGAGWFDLHADMLAQSRDLMIFATGKATPATATRIANRGTALALKMSTLGGKALRPVHATATANAKRLAKKR